VGGAAVSVDSASVNHLINDEGTVFLEWQATLSQADRYAPDRREFDFTAASSATDPAALRAQYDFQTQMISRRTSSQVSFWSPGPFSVVMTS